MADLTLRLSRLVAPASAEPDGNLLGRFLAERDGEAFAQLVHRHGPMVLAVCRRVLRHRQDAEDAFQATFLVLARRAGVVKPRSAVGNWLYGVAYRTALGARRVAAARQAREARARAMRGTEDIPAGHPSSELREALDRELAALPDAYRTAVVACDLEGLSRREAAARLGWTVGGLSSRLARGRSLLARRLRANGLAVPVAGLGVVAGPAAGAMPAGLADATARLGILAAAGEAVMTASVAALTEGTMKAMLLTKLKGMTAALMVGCAVLVTAGAGWRANEVGAADPPGEGVRRAEAPRKVRDADKDRIAELERERDRLLKEVAELRDRLAVVEAEKKDSVAKLALDQVQLAAERARARAQVEGKKAAERGLNNRGPESVPALPAAETPEPVPLAAPSDPRPRPALISPPPPRLESPLVPGGAPATADPLVVTRSSGQPDAPPAAKPVVRVYQVGELALDEKEGEALAKVVRATVDPTSWGVDAGVEYLPGRKVLVVRQTKKGHEEVADLLRLLKTEAAPARPK